MSIFKDNDEEVIDEIIQEEMEDTPNDELVKEEPSEEVIEEQVVEEPINNKSTIDDLKKIIYESLPKKITAETYFRTIKQVYDNFDE